MARDKKARGKAGMAGTRAGSGVPVIKLGGQAREGTRTQGKKKSGKPAKKAAAPAKKATGKKVPRKRVPVQYGAPPVDMAPGDVTAAEIEILASTHRQLRVAPAPAQVSGVGNGTTAPEPETQLQPEAPRPQAEAPAVSPEIESRLADRLLQGAQCTWIGTIDKTMDDSATGAPLCPYCTGRLVNLAGDRGTMQMGIEAWELGVYASASNSARPHPGYSKFVNWMMAQEECWPDIRVAALAYMEATGIEVDPTA